MFTAEVFQNPYLPQGAREVNAIMTITTTGNDGVAISTPKSQRLFGIICDISGSMGGAKMIAAKDAIVKIINLLPADAAFFVVTGASRAKLLVPLVNAVPENKLRAIAQVKEISANGGTLMSTWLHTALGEFSKMPQRMFGKYRQAPVEKKLPRIVRLDKNLSLNSHRGSHDSILQYRINIGTV